MGQQYYICGKWRDSKEAKRMLMNAAEVLETCKTWRLKDAARLVRNDWVFVASRPNLSERIINEANDCY